MVYGAASQAPRGRWREMSRSARQHASPTPSGTSLSPHAAKGAARRQCRLMQGEQLLRDCDYALRLEAKLLLQFLQRRRSPEGMHANDAALPADIAFPAERGALLYRDSGRYRGRQHTVLIIWRLVLKDIPGWHRDDARPDVLGEQLFVGLHSERNLAARRNQDDLRVAAGRISEDIGTAHDPARRRVFAPIQGRQGLTRQRQYSRPMTQLKDVPVCLNHLIGIARPQRGEPGDGPQRYQLLDRLVGRTILPV